MGWGRKKEEVVLSDVKFYFDSVARDRMDCAGLQRKSGQVLALRDKLLALPEAQFEAVITAISRLVEDRTRDRDKEAQAELERRRHAQELYQQSADVQKGSPTTATEKISSV